jgi:hypothetical protein
LANLAKWWGAERFNANGGLDVGKKTSELGFVGLKDCRIKVKTGDGQGFES